MGGIRVPQGDAGADCSTAVESCERNGGIAFGTSALDRDRRDRAGGGAPHAGISCDLHPERNRALGRADQGKWRDRGLAQIRRPLMDEEVLNTSLRRFLKKVGITAQREIEKAVREGIASGKLKGHEALHAKAQFNVAGIALKFDVEGDVELA